MDKERQLELIKKFNPFDPNIGNHTWIKSVDDIKTYEEVWQEEGELYGITPDFSEEDAKNALRSGMIRIYSSYPIKQGTFVTPSKMEAQSYGGNTNVYSKIVSINDVAWIDPTQGQYANLNENRRLNIRRIIREAINDYITNDSVNFLYHATPICYVDSIKQHGLGGKIPKTRFWDYSGTPYERINYGCFLATDEYVAESYLESSEEFDKLAEVYEKKCGKELEIVVFMVDVRDLNPSLLSVDTNQISDDGIPPTFFYNGIIPYDKLKKVELYN